MVEELGGNTTVDNHQHILQETASQALNLHWPKQNPETNRLHLGEQTVSENYKRLRIHNNHRLRIRPQSSTNPSNNHTKQMANRKKTETATEARQPARAEKTTTAAATAATTTTTTPPTGPSQ